MNKFTKTNVGHWVNAVHVDWAVPCGWWTDLETGLQKDRDPMELIALIHSELSEALEGVRKDLKDDHLSLIHI